MKNRRGRFAELVAGRISNRRGTVLKSVVLLLCLGMPALSMAQEDGQSVEELEAYIAEQKAALEEVRANRDETQKKVDEIREAMAEQDARKAQVEEELEVLCKEQEELKPGTYEDCKSQSES